MGHATGQRGQSVGVSASPVPGAVPDTDIRHLQGRSLHEGANRLSWGLHSSCQVTGPVWRRERNGGPKSHSRPFSLWHHPRFLWGSGHPRSSVSHHAATWPPRIKRTPVRSLRCGQTVHLHQRGSEQTLVSSAWKHNCGHTTLITKTAFSWAEPLPKGCHHFVYLFNNIYYIPTTYQGLSEALRIKKRMKQRSCPQE